jgi:hypothetical protein
VSEDKRIMFSGADWLKSDAKKKVSPFGEQVADLLGYAFHGIYHIQSEVLKADFESNSWIVVTVGWKSLCTYDDSLLTTLVFLAHWMAIRLQIEGASHKYLRLCFSPRKRMGINYDRHPSLDEAVASFKTHCGIDEVL